MSIETGVEIYFGAGATLIALAQIRGVRRVLRGQADSGEMVQRDTTLGEFLLVFAFGALGWPLWLIVWAFHQLGACKPIPILEEWQAPRPGTEVVPTEKRDA